MVEPCSGETSLGQMTEQGAKPRGGEALVRVVRSAIRTGSPAGGLDWGRVEL